MEPFRYCQRTHGNSKPHFPAGSLSCHQRRSRPLPGRPRTRKSRKSSCQRSSNRRKSRYLIRLKKARLKKSPLQEIKEIQETQQNSARCIGRGFLAGGRGKGQGAPLAAAANCDVLSLDFQGRRPVLTLLREEKSCYQKASANFIFLQLFSKSGVFSLST